MAKPIQIQIEVDSKGLTSGLAVASRGVDSATATMRDSLAGLVDATKVTTKSHEGLIGKLQEFKQETVQDARMARFLSNELLAVVPGAGAAGKALAGLVEVGLSGMGIGAIIELGKLVVDGELGNTEYGWDVDDWYGVGDRIIFAYLQTTYGKNENWLLKLAAA